MELLTQKSNMSTFDILDSELSQLWNLGIPLICPKIEMAAASWDAVSVDKISSIFFLFLAVYYMVYTTIS